LNGQLEQEGSAGKKVRADDVFSAFISKLIDMDQRSLEEHFVPFLAAWLKSRCIQNESWKFVVKRVIPELENYSSDLPKLPVWISHGLIIPLFRQNILTIGDLAWYVEEEKEELYDVTNQFKVAALLLTFMATECNMSVESLKS